MTPGPHESAAGAETPADGAGFPHAPPRLPPEVVRVDEAGVLWVGPRSFAWAQVFRETTELPDPLGSWHVRRARIMFEGGWQVSLTWGSGSYGTNYDFGLRRKGGEFTETPALVEVAILDRDRGLVTPPGADDQVTGYRTVADVLAIIDEVATWPTGEMRRMPPGWSDGSTSHRGQASSRRRTRSHER